MNYNSFFWKIDLVGSIGRVQRLLFLPVFIEDLILGTTQRLWTHIRSIVSSHIIASQTFPYIILLGETTQKVSLLEGELLIVQVFLLSLFTIHSFCLRIVAHILNILRS